MALYMRVALCTLRAGSYVDPKQMRVNCTVFVTQKIMESPCVSPVGHVTCSKNRNQLKKTH